MQMRMQMQMRMWLPTRSSPLHRRLLQCPTFCRRAPRTLWMPIARSKIWNGQTIGSSTLSFASCSRPISFSTLWSIWTTAATWSRTTPRIRHRRRRPVLHFLLPVRRLTKLPQSRLLRGPPLPVPNRNRLRSRRPCRSWATKAATTKTETKTKTTFSAREERTNSTRKPPRSVPSTPAGATRKTECFPLRPGNNPPTRSSRRKIHPAIPRTKPATAAATTSLTFPTASGWTCAARSTGGRGPRWSTWRSTPSATPTTMGHTYGRPSTRKTASPPTTRAWRSGSCTGCSAGCTRRPPSASPGTTTRRRNGTTAPTGRPIRDTLWNALPTTPSTYGTCTFPT
mmetsp:Transcript_22065/g.61377  ORF Transcript_22065/g.61377 Transcript_22065/m.61377 type:complete len:340 (+) Transcript_22065:387-1406(+)